MNAFYITIPIALAISAAAFAVLLASLRKGQYKDIEAAKYRIFFDEDK